MAEIQLPQLGESVTEGTITKWFKQIGDSVAEDEVLFEVSTDKVDSEVPSPVSGVLTEIRVAEGDTVDVGTVIAVVGDGSAMVAPATTNEPAVVVDTPAAQYGSDSAVIAARCGAALVVARQGKSQVVSLQDLVANLSETPAKLAGVIVNEF